MRQIVRGLGLVAAVATLSSCGTVTVAQSPADQGARFPVPATGAPTVHAEWASCAVDAPMDPKPPQEALTLPRLDGGFRATAAIHCQLDYRRRADGGLDLVLTEGRATDLTVLLTALRRPDTSAGPEACTLEMPWVPNLLLLDASGRWIRPGIPVDGCGKPLPDLVPAVRGLRLATVSERVVREIESAGAARAGCSQDHRNVVASETGYPDSSLRPGRGSVPFRSTAPVRLCGYRVPAEERGLADPGGDFAYGRTLSPQQRKSVERALTTLPPATDCAGNAHRFAVLANPGGAGGTVYVELDHCRRVLVSPLYGPPTLAQADRTFLGLVADLDGSARSAPR
ncbi:hypothetical protein ACIBJE_20530 [Micromonospora sp. NPDC050187]|uniref:hypothetical protein n=1 Tax=Micromonospora sp. NPDC050187 TaxID=3364277 RepID=UPI00379B0F1B